MSQAANQAGMPHGLVGRFFGRVMAWYNAPDNLWTLDTLNIDGHEQILEVGFGPGAAIELLVQQYPTVQVAGIDHSATMLQAASARNRKVMEVGQVSLQLASVTELPFADAVFDKAFSINCIYFWDTPVQGLAELHRVLKPGGQLGITVRDKKRAAYQAYQPEKLRQMLQEAGFETVEILNNNIPSHPLICALGTK